MTNPGTEAVRAIEKTKDRNRSRQRAVNALRREWVLDGELTADQLREHHRQLRADSTIARTQLGDAA